MGLGPGGSPTRRALKEIITIHRPFAGIVIVVVQDVLTGGCIHDATKVVPVAHPVQFIPPRRGKFGRFGHVKDGRKPIRDVEQIAVHGADHFRLEGAGVDEGIYLHPPLEQGAFGAA